MKNEIFIKIYNIIHSCKTMDQLLVAGRYLEQAAKNGTIAEEFRQAIFFSVYLDKQKELKK